MATCSLCARRLRGGPAAALAARCRCGALVCPRCRPHASCPADDAPRAAMPVIRAPKVDHI